MYVQRRTWIENGPRGVGDLATEVTVSDCSPDMCFRLPFPWVGQRAKIPDGYSVPGAWLDAANRAPEVCYCKPVIDVPNPWGTVITVGLAGLLGLKIVRGVLG